MFITCPKCGSEFDLGENVVAETGQVFQCALCGCQWEYQGQEPNKSAAKDFSLQAQEDKPLTVVDQDDLLEEAEDTDQTPLFPQWNSVAPVSLIPEEFRPIASRYQATSKGTALFVMIMTVLICAGGVYYYVWNQLNPRPARLSPLQQAVQGAEVLMLVSPEFQVIEQQDGSFSVVVTGEIHNPRSTYMAVPPLELNLVMQDGSTEKRLIAPTGELIEPKGKYHLSMIIGALAQRVVQLGMKIQ